MMRWAKRDQKLPFEATGGLAQLNKVRSELRHHCDKCNRDSLGRVCMRCKHENETRFLSQKVGTMPIETDNVEYELVVTTYYTTSEWQQLKEGLGFRGIHLARGDGHRMTTTWVSEDEFEEVARAFNAEIPLYWNWALTKVQRTTIGGS